MRVLAIDLYGNALLWARSVARLPGVEQVSLLADAGCATYWCGGGVTYQPLRGLTVDGVVRLASEAGIDVAFNANSLLGAAGVVEALSAAGVRTAGSTQAFSETEIDKRTFKHWLLKHRFRTPALRWEGTWDELGACADALEYPLVVKPDRQVGPPVSTCQQPSDLRRYLEAVLARVPAARHALLFLVEDYVPIVETMHVVYLTGPRGGRVLTSVRTPHNWKINPAARSCDVSLCPHPAFERFRTEIERFIAAMCPLAPHAIGGLQCGLTAEVGCYFIEHNARPGTATFGLLPQALPCLADAASRPPGFAAPAVGQSRPTAITAAVAMMHTQPEMVVDVERLEAAFGADFVPMSLSQASSGLVSRRNSFPSMLMLRGSTAAEVAERAESAASTMQQAGAYLPIDTAGLRSLLAREYPSP